MKSRAKFAYISYDSIATKIESGEIDSFDIVYTKDTHENLIISSDLTPVPVRAKVYVFGSVDEANAQINTNTDTYIGQIVSIIQGDVCKGYIVNKNQDDVFYVEQISADNIDYNNLGNRPIENLVGTFDSPIFVDTLDSGIYKIKGEYKITANEGTGHLSTRGELFLIEVTDTEKYIKRFAKDSIYDFVISDNGIESKKYATEDDISRALENALDNSIREYIETTVSEAINNAITSSVNTIIEQQLEQKINDHITDIEDEDINGLFG